MEFEPFPKIPRLHREILITEKIDGTNAQIMVDEDGTVTAGSRKRIITPEADNFGFARWVKENEDALRTLLGPGRHFGEWWGAGIQRTYGLTEKRFSLFNVHRWGWLGDPDVESLDKLDLVEIGVGVVPTLAYAPFAEEAIERALDSLCWGGSKAAPGFDRPEGIVVRHQQSGHLYKVLLENDGISKTEAAA